MFAAAVREPFDSSRPLDAARWLRLCGGVEFGTDEVAYGARVGFAAGDAHDLAHEELDGAAFAVAVVLDGLRVFPE